MGKLGQRTVTPSKIRVSSKDLTSPVPHLLGTNNTPTEEEASLIKEALIDARKHEKNLLTELQSSTRNPVTAFLRTQTKPKLRIVQDYILDHLALISSCRRLPAELLQIIFEYWQHAPNNFRGFNIRKGSLFQENGIVPDLPWTLSHVCRLWRSIVISSPKMWVYLFCGMIPWRDERFVTGPSVDLVTEILERSRGLPIDLQLKFPVYIAQEHRNLNSCLTLLVNHPEKWNSIKMSFIDTISAEMWDELISIRDHLPCLKRLELQVERDTDKAVNLFDGANNLEELSLSFKFRGTLTLPPSVKLRILQCSTSWPNFSTKPVTGLQGGIKFSHLTHLVLGITSRARISPGTTFPELTDMTLVFYWSTNQFTDKSFVKNVVVPSLEKLSIMSASRSQRPKLTAELLGMLHRSGRPPIHSFDLAIAHETPGSLLSLLSLTASLKDLTTSLPHHTDIEALANVNNDDVLVPFLETCRFDVYTLAEEEIPLQARLELRRLAQNRCDQNIVSLDSVAHPGNGEHLHSQLKAFSLNFTDGSFAVRHQCLFQGWEESALSRELEAAYARLMEIYPHILGKEGHYFYMFEMKLHRITGKETKEVRRILSNIYKLEVRHGSDIAISRILVPLTSMSQCGLLSKSFPFGKIATQILTKWLPLMEACMPTLRWSCYSTELDYVVNGKVPKKEPTRALFFSDNLVGYEIWYDTDCLAPFMYSVGAPQERLKAAFMPSYLRNISS